MELMLLMTIKTARLHQRWGMRNDSLSVPVGFPAPSDYKGVGKLTVDAQLRLWDTADWCKCLKRCDFGEDVFSC